MPVQLVDPATQAQGTLPASPVAGAFAQMIGGMGRNFPTAMDRADINYKNLAAQKLQQELGAPQSLADAFTSIRPSTAPQLPPEGPLPDGSPPPPPAQAQPQDEAALVQQNLPNLIKALAQSGNVAAIPSVGRFFTATAPGIPALGTDAQHPSPVSMAMMGAGDAYTSTPDATLMGATPGQRDRNAKINDMMQGNPGINRQQAGNVVDGVMDAVVDPTTKNVFLVNKLNGTSQLLHSPAQGTGQINGQPAPAAPTGAPAATPGNNPFNLRPVGATTGFQSFATPQDGLMAGMHDLSVKLSGQSQAMGGKTPTVRNIISTYSPPNENATAQLIQNAAQRMGVSPDQPLNMSHLLPLAQAVLQQEQGSGGTAQAAAAGQQPAQGQGAPASPQTPTFGPNNLKFDLNNVFGVGPTLSRVMSGNGGTAGDTLSQLNGVKRAMAEIDAASLAGRNNQSLQHLSTEQLPFSDKDITSPLDLVRTGWQNGSQGNLDIARKMNDYVAMRKDFTSRLADPNTSSAERDEMTKTLPKIDNLISTYAQGPEADAYRQQFGLPATGGAAPAAPAQPSNLDAGNAATTLPAYKNIPGQTPVTAADIQHTAQIHGMTPSAVIAKLRQAGKVE